MLYVFVWVTGTTSHAPVVWLCQTNAGAVFKNIGFNGIWDLAIKAQALGDVVIVYMDESYVHQNHFPKRCWFHPDRPKVTRPRGKGQSETHHCVRHNEGWASSLLSTWGRQPTSSGRVWLRCISHQRNGFPSKKSSWRLSWSDGLRYVHHVVQAAPGSSIWDQISR